MSARVVAILGSGGGAGGSEKRDGHRHDDAACDCVLHFHPEKYKYLEETRYGMMVLQRVPSRSWRRIRESKDVALKASKEKSPHALK
jgi:hypothetical protein